MALSMPHWNRAQRQRKQFLHALPGKSHRVDQLVFNRIGAGLVENNRQEQPGLVKQ